jgi:hypothetical protein
MSLLEIQSQFAAGVFSEFPPALQSRVVAGKIAAAERLAIYRNNVLSNLRGALRDSYPVIFRLLGEVFFNGVATEYIRCQPSRSGDLHDFGGEFAVFLELFEPCADLPYLADVARLEWAWDSAFHAADTTPATPSLLTRLQAVPPESYVHIQFQLNAGITLLTSTYPILNIWQANQPEHIEVAAVDIDAGGGNFMVFRDRAYAVLIRELSAGEFAFLQATRCGKLFEEATAQALAAEPEFNPGIALHRFFENHIVTDFALENLP